MANIYDKEDFIDFIRNRNGDVGRIIMSNESEIGDYSFYEYSEKGCISIYGDILFDVDYFLDILKETNIDTFTNNHYDYELNMENIKPIKYNKVISIKDVINDFLSNISPNYKICNLFVARVYYNFADIYNFLVIKYPKIKYNNKYVLNDIYTTKYNNRNNLFNNFLDSYINSDIIIDAFNDAFTSDENMYNFLEQYKIDLLYILSKNLSLTAKEKSIGDYIKKILTIINNDFSIENLNNVTPNDITLNFNNKEIYNGKNSDNSEDENGNNISNKNKNSENDNDENNDNGENDNSENDNGENDDNIITDEKYNDIYQDLIYHDESEKWYKYYDKVLDRRRKYIKEKHIYGFNDYIVIPTEEKDPFEIFYCKFSLFEFHYVKNNYGELIMDELEHIRRKYKSIKKLHQLKELDEEFEELIKTLPKKYYFY